MTTDKKTPDSGPKYPNVVVSLTGSDGNAFSVLGAVRRAMKRARLPETEVDAFTKEATSGDYNHLLATAMRWVEVQ